jgi:hypothetical protein
MDIDGCQGNRQADANRKAEYQKTERLSTAQPGAFQLISSSLLTS